MFDWFKKFDDYLFDAKFGYENVSKKIQSITGMDCFEQSILCSIFSLSIVVSLFGVDHKVSVLYLIVFLLSITSAYSTRREIGKTGQMNNQRIIMMDTRLYLVIFCTFSIIFTDWVTGVIYFFLISSFYLKDCNPLPPGDSWLEKKWSGFKESLQSAGKTV